MRPYGDIFLDPIIKNIPPSLRQQPFAVWTAEPRPNKPGKYNKAPRSPQTGRRIGTDKPDLFGTFDEAVTAFQSGKYTGIGVLLTGNGIVGVDIDNAAAVFNKRPEVKAWLRQALEDKAYAEYSPSRTGYRLFFTGGLLPETVMRKHGDLEIYDDVRFLTVTGHLLETGGSDA